MVVLSKVNTMASYNILFFFMLVSLLSFATTEAQDDSSYLNQYCSSEKTKANTSFQFALTTLLSSLSSNATGDTQFYNTTVTGRDPSDPVYGLFMCRGDVPSQLCQQCVVNATQRLSSDCPLSKEAVIWYEECRVRYSNSSFFSTVDTTPSFFLSNTFNVSNPESFMRLLFSTMNETGDEAASPPIGEKKFATRKATVSGSFQTIYCLAQCTPDLSPDDCRTCLRRVIGELPSCCDGKQGARAVTPSCNIRYDLYPFFYSSVVPSPTPAPSLVPATNTSRADSNFAEDPIYLSHNCSSNQNFTANSTFQVNVETLLSYLSSNATNGKKFYPADVGGTYGLFMCRGDVPFHLCEKCVLNATHRISSECRSSQEGIIWYSQCMLRYSHRYFYSTVNTSPIYSELNITDGPIAEQNFFTVTLSNELAQLANLTGKSVERFETDSSKLNSFQTLYTLGQCTPDLSSDGCTGCLQSVIGTAIPWSRLGSVGGRVMYPSCNLRFELFPFYMDGDEAQPPNRSESPSPEGPTEERDDQSRRTILIVVLTIVFAMVFLFGYYCLRRKARKSYTTILRENFGQEYVTLEPFQFNLTMIEAATNNFADENKIGKGGFGEVYKGILLDGRQIAVKRLSRNSKQGASEFKNEILLIAKLQHRNLVAFIGFCLEEHEKILIYEYVTNKSLDYFLIESRRQKLLSWFERYNIIGGIAQGILYLHEHSRLKVIHRDLKPSNILLDETMNPKISDFGLSRLVEMNQDQGCTNRIVGTYGYMSPEYAMLGQFSEKSDVFSFGVMVLEIITGKKNASSYESHRVADSLLSYVWRQWRDRTPLNTLDPNIKENYSEIEVKKCIQIGLLCVQQNPDARPTMTSIVSYLSSHFIELPTPQEPAFFLHGTTDAIVIAQDSSSSRSINSSILISNNGMSISEFIPR